MRKRSRVALAEFRARLPAGAAPTHAEQVSMAGAVWAARAEFRRAVLRSPMAADEAYHLLCHLRDGDMTFDRVCRTWASGGLTQAAITDRLPGHLDAVAALYRRRPDAAAGEEAVRLIEELGVRVQRLVPMADRLGRLAARAAELAAGGTAEGRGELAAILAAAGEPDVAALAGRVAAITAARAAYEAARRAMADANLRLVARRATDFAKCPLPMEDMLAEGVFGLLRAVDRWEAQGRFSTFAMIWIGQAISRAVSMAARTVRVPVHVADKMIDGRAVAEVMSHRLGRPPTDAEVAAGMGLKDDAMRRVLAAGIGPASLDRDRSASHERSGLRLRDAVPARGEAAADPDADAVSALLASLPYFDRCLMEMRFGLGDGWQYTAAQAAAALGVDEATAAAAEAAAAVRLRGVAAAMGLGRR